MTKFNNKQRDRDHPGNLQRVAAQLSEHRAWVAFAWSGGSVVETQ